ncbi:MAG: phosphate ABC transporter permease subunit PstC [Nitrososphaerota archaeon]
MRMAEAVAVSIRRRKLQNSIFTLLFFSSALVATVTLVVIYATLIYESIGFFQHVSILEFITGTSWTVLFEDKKFGVLPIFNATLITSGIAIALAAPAGLAAAIFLSEYASTRVRSVVKPVIETLSGIPTVVYGYFALYFLTPEFLRQLLPGLGIHNALAVGLMIGVLILPIVASISDDALLAVPADLRFGAYALGARKVDVVIRIVVPAALSGITASVILAFARAMGETMVAAIAGGFRPILSWDASQAMETMTAYIAQVATGDAPHGTIEYQSLFSVGLFLLLVTALLNFLGLKVVKRWAIRY